MKKFLFGFLSIFLFFSLFGFEWPQENITLESYSSYFGQERGGLISHSLIFEEPSQIKAAENGKILAIIIENNDDSDFFPSTLGTALILTHEDNLQSVYGNLESSSLTLNDVNETFVDSGTILGQSGTTAWQEDKGNLEFQIIDTKNQSAINPKILMPRTETEIPLLLSGIYIENKNNVFYDLNAYKTFPFGIYRIYQKKNDIAVPYKTSVSINGVIVDQINYDTIIQENNKICITGKKKYTSSDVYPKENFHLLGEAMFIPGKITLGLSEQDMLGNYKNLVYNITVK